MLTSVVCAEKTSSIHSSPSLQLAGLKRSAAVVGTTQLHQRSCGVNALTVQRGFATGRAIYIILGRL